MIIMDLKIDNFYLFQNFHMNMSYPKKIVDSTIDMEYLEDRPNFRYKKVNIIMGANASGKTSIGRFLMQIFNYFKDENPKRFTSIINHSAKPASFCVDFVLSENIMYRFLFSASPAEKEFHVQSRLYSTEIGRKDNYETSALRLDEFLSNTKGIEAPSLCITDLDLCGWHFSYPLDSSKSKSYYTIEDNTNYLHILEKILKALDPSIESVIKLAEIDNAYAIKIENQSIIIQDGKINDTMILSSGTKAGLDISYIIASLICDLHAFYYCDELFTFVSSDIEKACLSIMIDKLIGRKQLFFTTHNTEILDMQLPKHSFTFLKKEVHDQETTIKCICASDFLKRNTDSLKNAVENDLFSIAPNLESIYEIEDL